MYREEFQLGKYVSSKFPGQLCPLFLQRDELNLSRRGMQLQQRTAAIQIAFRGHFTRAIIALGRDMNSWKLAVDSFLARSYINDRVHADFQVRRKIHNDVTNTSLERGVTELSIHRHELGSNAACASLCADAMCHSEAMNTAAAGLRFDWPTATTREANAA